MIGRLKKRMKLLFHSLRKRASQPGILYLIAVVCILVTAGCTGKDYIENTDIEVVKFTPDEEVEWSKVPDSGNPGGQYYSRMR